MLITQLLAFLRRLEVIVERHATVALERTTTSRITVVTIVRAALTKEQARRIGNRQQRLTADSFCAKIAFTLSFPLFYQV